MQRLWWFVMVVAAGNLLLGAALALLCGRGPKSWRAVLDGPCRWQAWVAGAQEMLARVASRLPLPGRPKAP